MQSIVDERTGDLNIPVLTKKTQEYVEAQEDKGRWAEGILDLCKSRGENPETYIKKMTDYALELQKKYPHWKPQKLSRKVAEHFKINLV